MHVQIKKVVKEHFTLPITVADPGGLGGLIPLWGVFACQFENSDGPAFGGGALTPSSLNSWIRQCIRETPLENLSFLGF